ncbi:MAG: hypothetical protein GY875_11735 [Gammaproteobacteria bacterium]|nr:hypothetical protein [Gammaproteobacteria bacterium]
MKGFDGKLVGSVYPISREECQRVHDAAIRVLEQGGVRCDDERAATMFEDAGCTLENNRKLIKFPEKAVMDALDKCPSSFTLHGRNDPGLDCSIGTGEVHFCTVTGRYIDDIRTGERRKVTRQDAIDGTLMADALEHVHGLYKPVMWLYDEEMICNSQILTTEWMKHTNKPGTWVYNTGAEHEVSDLIKMWQIAAGGEEEMRRKPHMLGHVVVNPPRVIDVHYTDWLIGFCDSGTPLSIESALMGGATGPATRAGMLVQCMAEIYSLVVQSQSYKPGHPLAFCSFSPAMDMRTGLWATGTPEYGINGGGIAAMANFHNVPVVGFGMSDSCEFDQQTAHEKALKNYNYALAGLSWIIDLGGTAGFNLVSWPEMVLENEMAAYIGEYLKGIQVDEERLSVDTILKVGPLPGSYMKEKHTRKWFREEFFMRELNNKDFFESWQRGHVELQEKARQKALSILDNHQSPVAAEIQQELESYLDFCLQRDLG